MEYLYSGEEVVCDEKFWFIFLLIYGPSLLSQSRDECRANNRVNRVVLREEVCRRGAFSLEKEEEKSKKI